MSRGLSAGVVAALQSKACRVIQLIDGEWESGHLYLTNYARNITWNGNEYIAMGHLLSIGAIDESLEFQSTDGSINLSGLSNAVKALALEEEFTGNPVKIYFALLDDNDQIIDAPFLPQEGLMNGMSMEDSPDSGAATVSVKYTSHLARFDDVRGRKTNPSEWKRQNPNDTIMNDVPKLTEKNLRW